MSLGFIQPLERGGKIKPAPKAKAVTRTLTEDELDSCWYCQHCNEPMLESEDGFVDPQSRIAFCSESCRNDYAAEGWWD